MVLYIVGKDLRLYKEFTDKDFERLAPYFTFN